MKTNIKIMLIFLAASVYLSGQYKPYEFNFSFEKKAMAKYVSQNPASNSINDIMVVGDTIWLATSRGLSKSTDDGQSWTNFYGDGTFGTESITALVYDYPTHSVWAATAHTTEVLGQNLPEGTGVHYSVDGGLTWKSAPQPVDPADADKEVYGINTLKAVPVTTRIQNIIYDLAITPNMIWAATFAGGLRKCRIDSLLANANYAWSRVVLPPDNRSTITPTDTLSFCMSPVSGKICSDNNYNYRVFSLAVAEDTVLYVGTADGINKTTGTRIAQSSNDMSWEKFQFKSSTDFSISGNFVTAMDYNPYSKTVWAATWKANGEDEEYGVSFSSNGGNTWYRTLLDEKVHNFGLYRNLTIAVSDNGAFRSYDYGNSWATPGAIVDNTTKYTLKTKTFYSAAFAKNGQELWLGSDAGLMKQTGYQSAWGANWKIYLASPQLEAKDKAYAFPNPFSPKAEFCRIKYSTGGKSASVTIRIFNFGMKYIRTIVQNASRGGGVHQTDSNGDINGVVDDWDGRDDAGNIVPNGVYFYRIDVDSNDPVFGKIMVLQ